MIAFYEPCPLHSGFYRVYAAYHTTTGDGCTCQPITPKADADKPKPQDRAWYRRFEKRPGLRR